MKCDFFSQIQPVVRVASRVSVALLFQWYNPRALYVASCFACSGPGLVNGAVLNSQNQKCPKVYFALRLKGFKLNQARRNFV
eukprot:3000176-Rhodomonas_salina.1